MACCLRTHEVNRIEERTVYVTETDASCTLPEAATKYRSGSLGQMQPGDLVYAAGAFAINLYAGPASQTGTVAWLGSDQVALVVAKIDSGAPRGPSLLLQASHALGWCFDVDVTEVRR